MWSLKFLSGPKAGKEVFLQPGLTLIGRDQACQIAVSASGISKKHAQIIVKDSKVILEDLDSRNGTFIKGKQIRSQELKAGDRVALHNVIFEIRKKETQVLPMYGMAYPQTLADPNLMNQFPESNPNKAINTKGSLFENIQTVVKSYIDNVLLPGVYKLAEWMEFKFIVGCFIIGFIVVVTVFSSFPLISILKTSVEQESRNNAENIALTLAQINRSRLKKGLQTSATVDYALRRPGVSKAFIISAIDGRIIAPAEMAHTYPKSSVIHKARKINETTVEKIDSSSIAALVPIRFYNPETGEPSPRAYSVVIYDTNSLAVATKNIVSLLIQTLLITCIIGLILFFLLINLIEFPIKSINRQLEQALKDEKAPSVSINYQSQILNDLCSHVNSALNQISLNRILNKSDESRGDESGELNRQGEMNNLVEIIGFPALCINLEDETVASLNSNFSDQIGFAEILHQPLNDISDSHLKEHLSNLLEMGKVSPQEMVFGEITLNHMKLQSACQFVMGKQSPAYALITFMPPEAEEGVA